MKNYFHPSVLEDDHEIFCVGGRLVLGDYARTMTVKYIVHPKITHVREQSFPYLRVWTAIIICYLSE